MLLQPCQNVNWVCGPRTFPNNFHVAILLKKKKKIQQFHKNGLKLDAIHQHPDQGSVSFSVLLGGVRMAPPAAGDS